MKSAALVASLLFLITSETEAVVGSGPCRGKTVDVFVESSYLTSGDFWSDPDAYVKLTVGDVTNATRVVENQKYAAFNEWFSFKNAQSDELDVEVWDRDTGLAGDDDLMGRCRVKLDKSVADKTCRFDSGQVSFIYVCT